LLKGKPPPLPKVAGKKVVVVAQLWLILLLGETEQKVRISVGRKDFPEGVSIMRSSFSNTPDANTHS